MATYRLMFDLVGSLSAQGGHSLSTDICYIMPRRPLLRLRLDKVKLERLYNEQLLYSNNH